MPEAGKFGLPKKLLQQGVRDMVCISDGRMSGTAYGTVILHVAPEAAVGGPLALVQDSDLIELDVEKRSLNMAVPDEELQRRRQAWTPPAPVVTRVTPASTSGTCSKPTKALTWTFWSAALGRMSIGSRGSFYERIGQ